MIATGLIVFREVLEAALIIGIVMASARGVPGRGRWVLAGSLAGLGGACVVAVFANTISAAFAGIGQEILNAGVLFAAVIMLGWHNVWMGRHAGEITRRMGDLGRSVTSGKRPLYALSVVCGLAVLREGSEVVLFLYGIAASQAGAGPMLLGGVLGLAGGMTAWAVFYFGLLRVPTRHLFTVTSWMILLLAAGMAAQGAGYLVQADVLPSLGAAVWDTSAFLSEGSVVGRTLHTLVGYVARPAGIQVLFYLLTVAIVAALMIGVRRLRGTRKAASFVTAALVLSALSLSDARPARAVFKVYSPVVIGGEMEMEARGTFSRDGSRSKDSKQKQIYELAYAFTDRWISGVFAEFEKESGGSLRDEAIAWENIYQVFEQGEKWVDFGLYSELEFSTRRGETDKFEGKLLFEKPLGAFVHTLNVIGEQRFGPGADNGPELGYAWRSAWRWRPELEPSLEAFGEFGPVDDFNSGSKQEHKLGPVLRGIVRLGTVLNMKLRYELGYLFGLTSSTPDGEIKWLLELEVPL